MNRNTPTDVGKTNTPPTNPAPVKKHPHGRGEDVWCATAPCLTTETPPRTWGRQGATDKRTVRLRNTPTDVGKTAPRWRGRDASGKHPHGRGEDRIIAKAWRSCVETPPRTWGRLNPAADQESARGNTPTDVGKTRVFRPVPRPAWKHPHGRGEDAGAKRSACPAPETPPRTWGRQPRKPFSPSALRNTPTDVGKTCQMGVNNGDAQKHPHGRGEDLTQNGASFISGETPPRTWGRPGTIGTGAGKLGNTPTDVGKTFGNLPDSGRSEKHPHGRGEDFSSAKLTKARLETPPRTWGRPPPCPSRVSFWRNTPTDVGKTLFQFIKTGAHGKHPHGRGEDENPHVALIYHVETPPRTWGRPGNIGIAGN